MKRVLIADDSPSNREFLRTVLEHAGWHVEEAADGEQALALAHTHPPDLILLDVQMPRLDGYATLRALRAVPALAHVPVFAVTAYAMAGDWQRGHEAGFNAYLTKPLTRQRILAEIAALS
jgi:CheY-like chemotaxis protein